MNVSIHFGRWSNCDEIFTFTDLVYGYVTPIICMFHRSSGKFHILTVYVIADLHK